LYQYRVDIAPDEDRTQIRKALLREHREALGFYLFDGTVLFTPNRYPQVCNYLFNQKFNSNLKITL